MPRVVGFDDDLEREDLVARAEEAHRLAVPRRVARAQRDGQRASRSTFSPSFTAQTCLTSADAGEATRRSAITKRGRITSDEYRRFILVTGPAL